MGFVIESSCKTKNEKRAHDMIMNYINKLMWCRCCTDYVGWWMEYLTFSTCPSHYCHLFAKEVTGIDICNWTCGHLAFGGSQPFREYERLLQTNYLREVVARKYLVKSTTVTHRSHSIITRNAPPMGIGMSWWLSCKQFMLVLPIIAHPIIIMGSQGKPDVQYSNGVPRKGMDNKLSQSWLTSTIKKCPPL